MKSHYDILFGDSIKRPKCYYCEEKADTCVQSHGGILFNRSFCEGHRQEAYDYANKKLGKERFK